MKTFRKAAVTAGLMLLSATASSVGARAHNSALPPSPSALGIDVSAMDTRIKPGDDFYLYANGDWQAKAVIPDDKTQVGAYYEQRDTAYARIRQILVSAAADPRSKIGAFYSSFMNETQIEATGLKSVRPGITEIQRSADKLALDRVMADLQRSGVTGLFEPLVFADSKAPSQYALYLEQAGLGLPDRHFYLDPDKDAVAGREAYTAYAVRLLTLAGQGKAAQRVTAVLAFETQIAKAQWSDEAERDESKTSDRFTIHNLTTQAPGFDWASYFTDLGTHEQSLIVREPSAFIADARVWAQTPLPILRDWLLIRYLDYNAAYLQRTFQDASFAFHSAALSGVVKPRPRTDRAASLVANQMADGVGRAYVEAYFPPTAKTEIEAIVANIKASFRGRLASETWMSEATRQKAIRKLDTFEVVVGYPDRWRDDFRLEIKADDLAGNIARAERYSFDCFLQRLGTKVNRREFDHSAALPWAWATPTLNEIGFSAAFLQPPYFDPAADPAVNYGAIGVIIGHELSHHFDDQGSKHDAEGRLADWWTPDDLRHFSERTKALVAQYDAYEPAGLHVNGALTLGENLADLAGLNISYQAYLTSLSGKPSAVINGFTGPQRFFLGHVQSYRSKQRDADLRNHVLSDPHPPEKERSEEVRNLDAWYDAFQVKPGDAMYLVPERRVKIW